MSEAVQPYQVSRSQEEFVEDPGLDEHSVAAMTAEEVKEYLALLFRVLRPTSQPHVAEAGGLFQF